MKKYKAALLLGWFAVILFLMTASFTNLIFDEDKEAVYDITFVLDDDEKPQYDMLKRGIEKARQGTGVKLFYLNLYGTTEKEDIINLLKEQLQQKDMVIVKCDSSPLLQDAVLECNEKQNMICINAGKPSRDICCNIYTDELARGNSLAQRIQQDQGNDCTIYVFGSAYEKIEQDVRMNSLKDIGLKVVHCLERADNEIGERLHKIKDSNETAAVVGMQPETIKQIVRLAEKERLSVSVYGFGYDSEILHDIEDGKIESVNVISDYHMGYASVYSAWLALEGERGEQNWELANYTVGRDEMFLDGYAEILFAED